MKDYKKIFAALFMSFLLSVLTVVISCCSAIFSLILLSGVLIIHLLLFVRWKKASLKAEEIYHANAGENDWELFSSLTLENQFEKAAEAVQDAARHDFAVQSSLKETELNTLQSQINPHFLYNTLDSIRWHALNSHAPEVANMLEILASFFRYSIGMKESVVTIYDELNNIKDYFAIQQYRFTDRLHLQISYDDEDILRCHIPKMTLQPLVENAVFHGLEQRKDNGLVDIQILHTQNTLYIHVADNGQGMAAKEVQLLNRNIENNSEPKRNDKRGGMALWNINQRIKLFFGQDYGIHIYSTEMLGTEIVISLPWINTEKPEISL